MKSVLSKVKARLAHAQDSSSLLFLWERAKDPYLASWSLSDIEKYLEKGQVYIISGEGEESQALLVVGPLVEGEVEILQVFVDPSQRRRGLAKALIACFIEQMRDELKELFLEVHEDNLEAKAFYFGLGFKEVGIRHSYYKDGGAASILKMHIKDAK